TDMAVEALIAPTDEQRFARLNPAISTPRISFRNLGSDPIRSLTIVNGTEGFPTQTYHWKGNLPFNQVAEVFLPGEVQAKDGENVFHVVLSQPNGKKDAWTGDNEMKVSFTAPERFPSKFVMQFLTNKKPEDNSIFLVNAQQDTLFRKIPSELKAETLYIDTIDLAEGNYSLQLLDASDNGLQFWAQPANGDGHLRLFDLKGSLIHAFESDWGSGEMFSFKAVEGLERDATIGRYAFSLYPRSVVDKMQLSVVSNKESDMTVEITVDGVLWQKHEYKSVKDAVFNYDINRLPAGRIIVEAFMDGVSQFKGRINKRWKKICYTKTAYKSPRM